MTCTTIAAALTLAAALLPTAVLAQSAACKTTDRFPHSIAQTCQDGTTQQVYFPADVSGGGTQIMIQSSSGATSIGTYSGPWLIWTDLKGVQCATGIVVSQAEEFYPLTCPPAGVPAV